MTEPMTEPTNEPKLYPTPWSYKVQTEEDIKNHVIDANYVLDANNEVVAVIDLPWTDDPQTETNEVTILMTAAPKMLAMLKRIIKYGVPWADVIEVIDKAEGRAQCQEI